MVTGIKAVDCLRGVLKNNLFIALDVGIELTNSDMAIEDSDFIGTKIAVKGRGDCSIKARNLFHSESLDILPATLLSLAIRRANNGYV